MWREIQKIFDIEDVIDQFETRPSTSQVRSHLNSLNRARERLNKSELKTITYFLAREQLKECLPT